MLHISNDYVFDGQGSAPTPADALVTCARAIGACHAGGTHHFAGTPDTTWAAFARAIIETAALSCRIEEIPTEAYPTPATRPLNSRLDCSGLARDFGIASRDWRAALSRIVKELQP